MMKLWSTENIDTNQVRCGRRSCGKVSQSLRVAASCLHKCLHLGVKVLVEQGVVTVIMVNSQQPLHKATMYLSTAQNETTKYALTPWCYAHTIESLPESTIQYSISSSSQTKSHINNILF